MRVSTKFALPLATLLFGLLLVPRAAVAQSWSAAANFEKGWIAKTNPNGVWSYGYSSGFTEPITLYNQTLQGTLDGPQTQAWLSPSVDNGDSPSAVYNNGPAYNNGNVDLLADEFVLVAGIGGQYSDLVFTAPAAAAYSIVSKFRGAQINIGTVVGVVQNGKVNGVPFSKLLFSSKVTSLGQLVPFNTEVSLKAGETLVFSVGPGGGWQNTGLSATITTVPCTLSDTLIYDATTSTLTMKFTIGNDLGISANWSAWLTYADPQGTNRDTMQTLFSVLQPITSNPPVAITKTLTGLPKEGVVGVLSTLSTPANGIACSSWVRINTGTEP
jgi:hypothetical protein